jgi:hypothetical protein
MHTYLKGVTMKRIARTLVIVTFASAAAAAVAADTPYPAEAQQETPLSSEFPNITTYKQEHKNDAGQQSRTPASRSARGARSGTAQPGTGQSSADQGMGGAGQGDSARGATR